MIDVAGLRVVAVGDEKADTAVVLLHGFQMRPDDLEPFAHSLGVEARFLFPEAPLAAEPQGRAWWHIDAKARERAIANGPRDFAVQHPPDLPAARARLGALLDAIEAKRIFLGGFSQGGMLVADTLVRSPAHARRVEGMLLLSASRIAYDEWSPHLAAGHLRDMPVLVSHGQSDPDLAFGAGVALRDALAAAGASVTFVAFEGGHEIPLVVWRAARKFLREPRVTRSDAARRA